MEAIVAIDIKNGLSKNGTIPWKAKKDMQFFYQKTKNNVVIMGKNTYFSIPEENRPLKNRLNIVLTREPNNPIVTAITKKHDNILFTDENTIHETIMANREKYNEQYPSLSSQFKIYIIGCKQIYDAYIPLCKTLWLTTIKCDYSCDLFFDFDIKNQFKEVSSEEEEEDDELKIVEYRQSNA
jgi:dihydrofolate reductase